MDAFFTNGPKILRRPDDGRIDRRIVLHRCDGRMQKESPGIVSVCNAPTVIRTSPVNGGTNEALNKTTAVTGVAAVKLITATFSTPMDPNTISGSTFTVQQGAISYPGTVSYTDTTAIFVLPNGLAPSLTYTCTITTGVKDLAGIALASNYVWTFSTIATGTPTLVAPADASVNQATSPMMIWNVVQGANTYRLQISTTNTFASTVYDDSTRTSTSQAIPGLAVGTTYYWRVDSKISGGTSAYSNVWSFTTIGVPAAPVLIAPLDAAINITTSPNLSWNASAGAATYHLQVSTSNTFAVTLFDDSTLTGTSQSINGLSLATGYYWRVSAKNVAGTSAYSSRSFTTIAAGTPTLVAPLNGALSQSTSPTMIWNAVAGAATYRLQVSTSNTFATTVYDDSTRTVTSQLISGLTVGTTYCWRVNSKTSGTSSVYSDVWSFTTIADTRGAGLGRARQHSDQPGHKSDADMERRRWSRNVSFTSLNKQHVWYNVLRRLDTHDCIAVDFGPGSRNNILLARECKEHCRNQQLLYNMELYYRQRAGGSGLSCTCQCSCQPAHQSDIDLERRAGSGHVSAAGFNGQHVCHNLL